MFLWQNNEWCWIWGANLAVGVFELGSDLPGNVQAMAKVMPDIPTERSKATPAGKKCACKKAQWTSCLFKNHHQRLWLRHEYYTNVWPRMMCSCWSQTSWKHPKAENKLISWIFGCQYHFYSFLTWLCTPSSQNSLETLTIIGDGIKTLHMAATEINQHG